MERLRIPMMIFMGVMIALSFFYAFHRRPSMLNKILAVASAAIAVTATAVGLWRG